MRVAQFVQRYPPALGGSEAYTARLCEYLAACGDDVRVWTSTAVELSEMWARPTPQPPQFDPACRASPADAVSAARGGGEGASEPVRHADVCEVSRPESPSLQGGGWGVGVTRYPPLRFPLRRYALKAASLVPHRFWQCLTQPCNPVCPGMWRDAGRYNGPLDAVHATAFPYSFPIACGLRLARRRGVPFLLTPFLHLGDPADPHDATRRQYTKPHLRWLLRQADRVFVQTAAERDAVVALGVEPNRVVLQGLGVEPAECTGGDRADVRRAWGVGDEVVIGHLANNSAEKGTIDLLRAAERLWCEGKQFRVVLAGPEMPNFRSFWTGFGPKERVVRLGVLTGEQKRDFFAGIDVFALPSRCDSFGLVLLEAWANGKPNVVYRAGGPGELVRHERDGLQTACGDVAGLARQLGRLIADEGLRHALGACGASRAIREFVWRDKLELVRHTLREIVSHRGLSSPRRGGTT